MTNQKISTLSGTIILIIIAVTVFLFVWVYSKTQSDTDRLSNSYETAINTTGPVTSENKTLKGKGMYLQIYENKTYGYKLKYAPNAVIAPNSSDEEVTITDVPDYRRNTVAVSSNSEELSLDQILNQIIGSKKLDLKNIVVTDIFVGQRHGKKLSIENSDYEYSTVIFFLNNNQVFTISGNERGNVGKNSLEFILNSFDFGDGPEARERSFIGGSSYFIDQSGIYYLEQFGALMPLKGVDTTTFKLIGNCGGGEVYFSQYGRDKNHIYMNGNLEKDIDVSSFQYLGFFMNYDGMPWGIAIAQDKNHIYYGCGKPVDSIRKESFEVLDYGYAKDSKSIYYLSSIIKTVDYKSFKILGLHKIGVFHGPFSLDKNNVYFEGRIIKGIPPKNCENRGIEACLPENWHDLLLESESSLSPLY